MSTVVSGLASLLPAEQVVSREQIADSLAKALSTTTADGSLPAAVVYPKTEAELAAVMAAAHAHRWRVLPWGSGSKLSWGGLASGFDLGICTQHLNHVVDHAVGDMTLTAAAGLKLTDLKAQLTQHGQFLAVDPAYADQATLGGIVATGDTGSLRQRYNSVRDMVIGMSFVRHDGQIAKAGGRVVKNVAGYDLMKLMTGAYGSLGILSQLTFRLYPIPETSKTVAVSGEADDIAQLTAELRQSSLTPIALDLLSPQLAKTLDLAPALTLMARFQSNLPGVDEQVNRLAKMAVNTSSLQVFEREAEAELWDRASHALFPPQNVEAGKDSATVMAKVGVVPASAVEFLVKLHQQMPQVGYARIHAGSGIGTLRMAAETTSSDLLKTIRQWCNASRGYLTVLQAPKPLKQAIEVWGYAGDALPLMGGIKEQFDPHSLLNPGRFVGGL